MAKTEKSVKKTPKKPVTVDDDFAPPTLNYQYPAQQSNKLLYGLLILNLLFTAFLFYKTQSPQTSANVAAGQPAAGTEQTASALTVDNLKKYAKDLGLNTAKFNSCLDKGEKANAVGADVKLAASVGVQGTPGFFVNGRFLGGAFPYQNFKEIIDAELSGAADGTCNAYPEDLKSYCSTTGDKGFNPEPKQIDLSNTPFTGPQDAKVTIVEFSDFQCPYCIKAFPTTQEILKNYPNDVKLYYKQLPLTSLHPYAQKAAEASECANDQGKFWQYHDKLFSSQGA